MKRRKFIQEGLLLAGALTLGHQTVRGKSKKKTATLHKDCVEEPARQVPILLESDVLVVGGGPWVQLSGSTSPPVHRPPKWL